MEEIILCYPGFFCISVYRLAHILYEMEVPVLPRIMSEYAHEKTGIDIHPGAEIDSPFLSIMGRVVIGETARIGKEVKIYQGVTPGRTHCGEGYGQYQKASHHRGPRNHLCR